MTYSQFRQNTKQLTFAIVSKTLCSDFRQNSREVEPMYYQIGYFTFILLSAFSSARKPKSLDPSGFACRHELQSGHDAGDHKKNKMLIEIICSKVMRIFLKNSELYSDSLHLLMLVITQVLPRNLLTEDVSIHRPFLFAVACLLSSLRLLFFSVDVSLSAQPSFYFQLKSSGFHFQNHV